MPADPTASEVKGVWFVTARAFLVERPEQRALQRVADHISSEQRQALLNPLASSWYPEAALEQALRGIRQELAQNDDAFLRVMEECTEIGISRFFRVLLRLSSASFVLRQVPAMWRQIRRGPGSVQVEAVHEWSVIRYRDFPYFEQANYRLLTLGSLSTLVKVCTGRRPEVSVSEFTRSTLDVVIRS